MKHDVLTQLRDSARALLSRDDHRRRVRSGRDSQLDYSAELWRELADAGWLAVLLAESDGGLGLSLAEAAVIAEEAGRALLPEPFTAVAVQAAQALAACPDSPLRSHLLAQLAAGQLLPGLAWQERAGQQDEDTADTRAAFDGQRYWLSGGKTFALPAAAERHGWLLSARGDEGWLLLWLPADQPGLSIDRCPGIDGSLMCSLTLEQAPVPHSHLLAAGPAARDALCQANDAARLAQSAELLGNARQILALTLPYLANREQFGRPISSFQALQHRLVDAHIQIELAAASLDEALEERAEPARLDSARISRLKARCADAAIGMGRLAIQLHGAIGYTEECDIGLYFKRALHLNAWLGNAEQQRRRYRRLSPPQAAAAETPPPALSDFPRDADWEAMPESEFRDLLRAFFVRHYPPALRHPSRRLHWHEIRDWHQTLARQGWAAPAWPKACGGMGLSPARQLAFIEEQERYGVARAPDQGIIMVGPLLLQHGSAEQQQRYLPKILSGEHIWCQGYSEPNAGSDLAALRTEAVPDGADFIVNGQKTWTTLAQDATHIFTLVRTDKQAKRQAGISFLLIALDSPGITVRPITTLAGHQEFCEVFFDQVRVPAANLVGGLNQGWGIAKALLGFERIFLGSPKQARQALAQLATQARACRGFDDPVFADRYARLELDVADLGALYKHFAAMVRRGEALPPAVSALKIWATETYQRISLALMDLAGEYGSWAGADPAGGQAPALLFNATPATIYGGSNEIQRNILARHVLRLPA
ncbi:acyl-CoA dehydrogenase [Chromobacterium aquaticum]|uniref:Acyl-CoA dehydrogenase n=1 Tax=Chromobacterium aquaticum TaxID=467180 RepID=A0ABV8ZUY4_9NEIS|nr:acyl-CoA dehydrogenase family protein [Chromobacterium aquaticum]MCD5362551.1 acyl-CoA dehydrogenase family protein [Chromobacterium aquaticum]